MQYNKLIQLQNQIIYETEGIGYIINGPGVAVALL